MNLTLDDLQGDPVVLTSAVMDPRCALELAQPGDLDRRIAWLDGFARDAAGALIVVSDAEVTHTDGTVRRQTIYRRLDGSGAEL